MEPQPGRDQLDVLGPGEGDGQPPSADSQQARRPAAAHRSARPEVAGHGALGQQAQRVDLERAAEDAHTGAEVVGHRAQLRHHPFGGAEPGTAGGGGQGHGPAGRPGLDLWIRRGAGGRGPGHGARMALRRGRPPPLAMSCHRRTLADHAAALAPGSLADGVAIVDLDAGVGRSPTGAARWCRRRRRRHHRGGRPPGPPRGRRLRRGRRPGGSGGRRHRPSRR